MKAPHLLRVEAPAGSFARLIEAAGEAGLRVGWLELSAPAPVPAGLEAAAGLGALRAVAVGPGRSVAVKPRRGEPVLEDLLREHFLGCRLVLVAAAADHPVLAARGVASLRPEGDGWLVEPAEGGPVRLTTDQLVLRLRRPRPW